MSCSKLVRTMVTTIALAGLGACLAGCVSVLGATTGEAGASSQMRYYGGPKSPMWPAQ
ncbi:ABC-type uncharacterized transport system permease subunit [Bradyrhizobium sp. USDA 4472]